MEEEVNMRSVSVLAVAVCGGVLGVVAQTAAAHEGDIVVGVSGAGQLRVEFDQDEPFGLPPVSTLLHGWAVDDPGFMSLEADEPAEDSYVLDPAADIAIELVAVDDAFNMWTPPFFVQKLDVTGEQWNLGQPDFDTHPFWHIDSDSLEFDPLQTEWQITLRVVDTREAAHLPSEDFTLSFVPVPEPGTMAVLGLGAVSVAMRRRWMKRG
jgi:hypothetical protein